jgi:hypothetical protein
MLTLLEVAMRGRVLLAALLLTFGAASSLRADEPQMLLRNSWAHIPDESELAQCPLVATPATTVTVALTCDIDDDGKLRHCQTDDRAPPLLAAYALCVSQYFEVRPGVSGQVFVPIGIGGPSAPRPNHRGRWRGHVPLSAVRFSKPPPVVAGLVPATQDPEGRSTRRRRVRTARDSGFAA